MKGKRSEKDHEKEKKKYKKSKRDKKASTSVLLITPCVHLLVIVLKCDIS